MATIQQYEVQSIRLDSDRAECFAVMDKIHELQEYIVRRQAWLYDADLGDVLNGLADTISDVPFFDEWRRERG
jgi:hypothetical protein